MCRGAEVGVKLHDLDSTQSQLKVLRHSVIGIEGDRIYSNTRRGKKGDLRFGLTALGIVVTVEQAILMERTILNM